MSAALIGYWLIQIDFHLFGYGRDPWAYRRGLIAIGYLIVGGLYWRYERTLSKVLIIYLILFNSYFPSLLGLKMIKP